MGKLAPVLDGSETRRGCRSSTEIREHLLKDGALLDALTDLEPAAEAARADHLRAMPTQVVPHGQHKNQDNGGRDGEHSMAFLLGDGNTLATTA
jgi:hypothetical protein